MNYRVELESSGGQWWAWVWGGDEVVAMVIRDAALEALDAAREWIAARRTP